MSLQVARERRRHLKSHSNAPQPPQPQSPAPKQQAPKAEHKIRRKSSSEEQQHRAISSRATTNKIGGCSKSPISLNASAKKVSCYNIYGPARYATESQAAESRAAALARANATAAANQNLQLPSSSNNVQQQSLPAYRHPIVYDKLTGATNNQINDVLGAGKQPTLLSGDFPIDHYQQQQHQYPSYLANQNLLADAQQQQRHRQQMLDQRQMLFAPGGPSNPFGSAPPPLLPPPPPPPPLDSFAMANQSAPNQPTASNSYYPDPLIYRQQHQQPPMLPQFQMPPPPPPQPAREQQQQQPSAPAATSTNQAPIRPPYAHLAPSLNHMQPPAPIGQFEQSLPPPQQQQQLKPLAQSRIIPLNNRIDPTSTSAATSSSQLPQHHHQQQQQPPPQMVLASNQPPPKQHSPNSLQPSPPLQQNGGGSNRLSSTSREVAAPLCVRQQIDQQQQQQQQQVPNATETGVGFTRFQMPVLFCNLDTEYPTREVMRALEIYAQEQRSIEQLLPQLLIQLHIQAPAARQPGGNHQLLTLDQLQASLHPAPQSAIPSAVWSPSAPQNSSNQQSLADREAAKQQFPSANFEQMCRSTIQMAQPRRAKNLAGQWKTVVNLPGHKYRGIAISQMVRVEECSAPLSECATPAKPSVGLAKSSCLQHYENQRLIVWSPQQGLHMDMFRLPVACSCHIRRS